MQSHHGAQHKHSAFNSGLHNEKKNWNNEFMRGEAKVLKKKKKLMVIWIQLNIEINPNKW